jgi:hypothetical protein
MTITIANPGAPLRFGRVRVAEDQNSVAPDLTDAEVVRRLLDDATRVARAEQAQRKRIFRKVR